MALVVASNPAWTGLGLHEWFAGLLLAPVIYHLAVNRDWVVRAASRLFARLKAISRANFVVDVILFVATVTVMLSGFMVLPGVIPIGGGTVTLAVWQHAHLMSSNITIAAMVAHFLLHALPMAQAASRVFGPKPGRHASRRPAFARSQARR